jgi:hypothetical protein
MLAGIVGEAFGVAAFDRDDAGPLCLLRHYGQLSTAKLVRPSGRKYGTGSKRRPTAI